MIHLTGYHILVAGAAGIGKTALVHEVHRPIIEARGYFCAGKYDQQQRPIPYAALLTALRSLIRQLLTEPQDRIAEWKTRLLTAVGSNGQILINVLPEVELIIGPQPSPAELVAGDNRARFARVFRNFLHGLANMAKPLVMFLDDMQWADVASLHLLEDLLSGAEQSHLCLIIAYRDTQVDEYPFTSDRVAEVRDSDRADSLGEPERPGGETARHCAAVSDRFPTPSGCVRSTPAPTRSASPASGCGAAPWGATFAPPNYWSAQTAPVR